MTTFIITRAPTLFDDPDAPPVDGATRHGDDWRLDVPDLDALLALTAHGAITIQRPGHLELLPRLRIE